MALPDPNANRLDLRFGGGLGILFGLPFLLTGLGVIAGSIAVHLGAADGDLPLGFGIPFGLIFAAVGYGIVFGRAGLTADREAGELVKWWGMPMPVSRQSIPISKAKRVRITKEIRRSNKSSYLVYPIHLEVEGRDDLKVTEPRQEDKARQTAELIAKFLRVGVSDASSGVAITRSYDELDLSLKQRFREGRIASDIPEVPAKLKSRIQFDGATLAVEIPPAGPRPVYIVALLASLGFALFAATIIFVPLLATDAEQGAPTWPLLLFGVLFLSVPTFVAFRLFTLMFLTRESLKATQYLVEYSRGWIMSKQTNMPAEEIEELELASDAGKRAARGGALGGSGSAILLRSDQKTLRFGQHLSSEEKAYLLALLRAVLVA